jgi:hypothetical protein
MDTKTDDFLELDNSIVNKDEKECLYIIFSNDTPVGYVDSEEDAKEMIWTLAKKCILNNTDYECQLRKKGSVLSVYGFYRNMFISYDRKISEFYFDCVHKLVVSN